VRFGKSSLAEKARKKRDISARKCQLAPWLEAWARFLPGVQILGEGLAVFGMFGQPIAWTGSGQGLGQGAQFRFDF
jgi:hypothetical protein